MIFHKVLFPPQKNKGKMKRNLTPTPDFPSQEQLIRCPSRFPIFKVLEPKSMEFNYLIEDILPIKDASS